MESTGLSISVIVIVVKIVEVGKKERVTKEQTHSPQPSHHSSARKVGPGNHAGALNHLFHTPPVGKSLSNAPKP